MKLKVIMTAKTFIRTLSSDKNDGYAINIAIVRHFCIISINRIEARLILETKDKNYSVNPGGELPEKKFIIEICDQQLTLSKKFPSLLD